MVFNGDFVVIALLLISFIWLGIVTVFVVRMIRHYTQLVTIDSRGRLKDILDVIVTTQKELDTSTKSLDQSIRKLQDEQSLHIKHVGIVRFNPFSDTGGSQSFSLALLDSHRSGIVMTSLYARTGNRWYIKHVHDAKATDYELSKEEESAIHQARPLRELKKKL